MRIRFVISLLSVSLLLAVGYGVVLQTTVTTQAQASCSVAPVNVQFRRYTGTDTAWVEGSAMTVQVGDVIDVNCFAQSGAQLLSGGQITATRAYQGQTSAVTLNGTGTQIRQYTLAQPGTYTFSCSNSNNTCANTDTLTVTGVTTATSPSPSPSASAQASASPTTSGVTSSCVDLTVADAACPVPGQSIRFRCQGSADADYFFFAYRRSPNEGMQELSRGTSNLSEPLEWSPFLQVQCNPCIGTTCASSESVNANCTVSYPSATSGGSSRADINRDGKVDIDDYREFLLDYLEAIK